MTGGKGAAGCAAGLCGISQGLFIADRIAFASACVSHYF
jgi:hypothetical protein